MLEWLGLWIERLGRCGGFVGLALLEVVGLPVEQPPAIALRRLGVTRREERLGGVDSRDSLLGANQIQGCFWGGGLGCDGTVGFERRGVGADSAADHRPA